MLLAERLPLTLAVSWQPEVSKNVNKMPKWKLVEHVVNLLEQSLSP